MNELILSKLQVGEIESAQGFRNGLGALTAAVTFGAPSVTDALDVKSISIPANTFKAGDLVKFEAWGKVIDQNGSDTLIPKINFDGTTLLTGATLAVADNDILLAEAVIQILSIGATGTYTAYATLNTDAAGGTQLMGATAATAIDTTAATPVALNLTYSAAHADNEFALLGFKVSLL